MPEGDRSDGLAGVPPEARPGLVRWLARARHDLGKYVAFQVRWVGETATTEELRAALTADLARTRAAGACVEDAPRIWARLRVPLVGSTAPGEGWSVDLRGDPDLDAVEHGISAIEAVLPTLRTAPRVELEALRVTALEIAGALQRLHARAARTPGP